MKSEELKREIGEIIDMNSELEEMVKNRDRVIIELVEKTIRELNGEVERQKAELYARKETIRRLDDKIKYLKPECRRNIIIRVLAQEESIGSQLDEIREMIQLGEVALKADPSDVDVKEGLYCLRKRERSLRMSLE